MPIPRIIRSRKSAPYRFSLIVILGLVSFWRLTSDTKVLNTITIANSNLRQKTSDNVTLLVDDSSPSTILENNAISNEGVSKLQGEIQGSKPIKHENDYKDNGDGTKSHKKKFKPTSYELDDLERVPLPHGVFYYGPHSHEIEIPESQKINYSWNEEQKKILDDEEIDIVKEKERCDRYNFGYDDRKTRRRLFAGIRIANDNILATKIVGTEGYNVFHTVAYEEVTQLHNLQPRSLRFNQTSYDLFQLMQSHGPKTKVSVDFYTTNATKTFGEYGLGVEKLQAESLTLRWKRNGMRQDDIGIIADADEMFTRDFLRAMQICDIPEFKSGQNCKTKIIASTLVFEGSPECLTRKRRWHHPDAILGECVHRIGNSTLHPPAQREYLGRHSCRLKGHAHKGNYSLYEPNPSGAENGTFPLWHASGIRRETKGKMISDKHGGHTGYHFHNIFESAYDIHFKYFTYGHSNQKAMDMPLWKIHKDIGFGINCTHDDRKTAVGFNDISGHKPIFFLNEGERKTRHDKWVQIVREEEKEWENFTTIEG